MSNKAKIRDKAKKLNPIDDLMFRKIAEDKAFCEEILRVILSDPKLIVLSSTPQWTGANLQGRSVILDAIRQLGDGRTVNMKFKKQTMTTSKKEFATMVLFSPQILLNPVKHLRLYPIYV